MKETRSTLAVIAIIVFIIYLSIWPEFRIGHFIMPPRAIDKIYDYNEVLPSGEFILPDSPRTRQLRRSLAIKTTQLMVYTA